MEYTKLNAWIESRKLANISYDATKFFPKEELFGMVTQVRTTAITIVSSIAEGCNQYTSPEALPYLLKASSFLYQLETQYYIALDQKYIDNTHFDSAYQQIQICMRLVKGLINSNKK